MLNTHVWLVFVSYNIHLLTPNIIFNLWMVSGFFLSWGIIMLSILSAFNLKVQSRFLSLTFVAHSSWTYFDFIFSYCSVSTAIHFVQEQILLRTSLLYVLYALLPFLKARGLKPISVQQSGKEWHRQVVQIWSLYSLDSKFMNVQCIVSTMLDWFWLFLTAESQTKPSFEYESKH